MSHDHESDGKPSSAGKYVLIGFALIAGYFLVMEHKAHVFGALPYLLLLACPLLHLFHGHGGHGGHGGGDKSGEAVDARKSTKPSESASGSKAPDSGSHRHH